MSPSPSAVARQRKLSFGESSLARCTLVSIAPVTAPEDVGGAGRTSERVTGRTPTFARRGCWYVRRMVTFDVLAMVIVEGVSDRVALETLAGRRGRNLAAEGISILPIGGAQAIGNVLHLIRTQTPEVRLAGLCDAGEEREFRRALERAGLVTNVTRESMEELGFYVCEADLEDELVRSVGPAAVEEILAAQGDLRSFRTFQQQRAWSGRTTQEQLRRFLGTTSGRKAGYARLLVEALDLARVPRPLDRVLAHV